MSGSGRGVFGILRLVGVARGGLYSPIGLNESNLIGRNETMDSIFIVLANRPFLGHFCAYSNCIVTPVL